MRLSVKILTERNLNPKAACLKRREEEKSEEGPKLGGMPHPTGMDPMAHQRLASVLPAGLSQALQVSKTLFYFFKYWYSFCPFTLIQKVFKLKEDGKMLIYIKLI